MTISGTRYHFQDISTFTVYMTGYDLEKSFASECVPQADTLTGFWYQNVVTETGECVMGSRHCVQAGYATCNGSAVCLSVSLSVTVAQCVKNESSEIYDFLT